VQIVGDAVVYWQITDPLKSVYEVVDLIGGIVQLTVTGMRSVMGDMDLDQCLFSREEINGKLRLILDEMLRRISEPRILHLCLIGGC